MKKAYLALLLIFTIIISGCKNQTDLTVIDREGNSVSISQNVERIISTAPSNTEIIIDLGLSSKLVAVDIHSSEIEGVDKNLPKLDFFNPNAETIISLNPDIIIASSHSKTGQSDDPFKIIKEAGISVVYVPTSQTIEGIYEDVKFISDILGEEEKGEEIISNMKDKITEIKKIGDTITDKKSVYLEISPFPDIWTSGGNTYLNEMIELVGATNIFSDKEGSFSPSAESIIQKNPDVIITNVDYIENPIQEIKERDGWDSINAVKNDEVYQIDSGFSSRPNHNIVKALEQIAKAIYPDKYGK